MCRRIFKNQTTEKGEIPFYKISTFGKKANSFISYKLYNKYRNNYSFPKKGDVLISASGTIGRTIIYDGKPAYFQDSNIVWIDNDQKKVLNKFLYYFYSTVRWNTQGGTIKRLYNSKLESVKIPIPPISLQKHIVSILDEFYTLANDLSIGIPAEQKARKKQYEYYRHELLTFKNQGGVIDIDLKHLSDIYTGKQLNRSVLMMNGKYPVLNGGIYSSGRYDEYNTEADTITISQGGASAGHVNYMQEKFWANAHCYVVKPNKNFISNRFLYYVLKNGQEKLMKAKKGAGIPGLSKDVVGKLKIPVPPISQQNQIVSILDQFDKLTTDLSTGLPAEQNARRKQYEYYRNELLTFKNRGGGAVEYKELRELGYFFSGLRGKTKNDFSNGDVKYISYKNVFHNMEIDTENITSFVKVGANENQNQVQYGDVIFTSSSETSEDCGMSSVVTDEVNHALYLNSFCFGFRLSDAYQFYPKFLKHYLRSKHFRKQIKKSVSGVTRFNISKQRFAKIKIPMPPMSQQIIKASILEEFDTLINDLSMGLPTEIKSRKKQYEFYRDKLLTFKEKPSEH